MPSLSETPSTAPSTGSPSRVRFAACYAARHLGLSMLVALLSAALVFGLLYPAPYRAMLGVESIFLLVLAVDVVCGPLLTLVLASPSKSQRERWLDFSLIGLIQLLALAYGLHSVWVGRPAVLGFEVERLAVVTANEIEADRLAEAPAGLRRLPWWGVQRVGTRQPKDSADMLRSVELGLSGVSLVMQPGWWLPWQDALPAMQARAKPLAELMARRPEAADALRRAARDSGLPPEQLRYLPLTSHKTLDWVALLDAQMNLVGWAPVDGF
ncbi:hypothetical protein [Ottowia sp.]|uniref:hypothetical protein n=1 Tax=Ottowia sp. TaxID=1898956 RepID=UPI002C4832B3|nr:hypothetical protein [Ottowia sp.]HNR82499.1 hypothetical protein [Ottowia sp.]HNT84311.1 hypothetical protein [Ottowia sp.]